MKVAALTLFIASMALAVQGQVKEYNHTDLFDLFSLDKFDKCAKKAEKLTESDKTSDDPEPYLWASMCHRRLADIAVEEGKDDSVHVKKSLDMAAAYMRKDKKKRLWEHNKDYIRLLRNYGEAKANELYFKGNIGATAGVFSSLLGLQENNHFYRLMMGMCYDMNGFKSKGRPEAEKAITSLKNEATTDDSYTVPKGVSKLVSNMIIDYTDYLFKANRIDESRSTIKDATVFLGSDERVMGKYRTMN